MKFLIELIFECGEKLCNQCINLIPKVDDYFYGCRLFIDELENDDNGNPVRHMNCINRARIIVEK